MFKKALFVLTCVFFLEESLSVLATVTKEDADKAVNDAYTSVKEALTKTEAAVKKANDVQKEANELSEKKKIAKDAKDNAEKYKRQKPLAKSAFDKAKKTHESIQPKVTEVNEKVQRAVQTAKAAEKVVDEANIEILRLHGTTSTDNDHTSRKQKADENLNKVKEALKTLPQLDEIISEIKGDIQKLTEIVHQVQISSFHAKVIVDADTLKNVAGNSKSLSDNCEEKEVSARSLVDDIRFMVSKVPKEKTEKATKYLEDAEKALAKMTPQVITVKAAAEKVEKIQQKTNSYVSFLEKETSVSNAENKAKEMEEELKLAEKEQQNVQTTMNDISHTFQHVMNAKSDFIQEFGEIKREKKEEKTVVKKEVKVQQIIPNTANSSLKDSSHNEKGNTHVEEKKTHPKTIATSQTDKESKKEEKLDVETKTLTVEKHGQQNDNKQSGVKNESNETNTKHEDKKNLKEKIDVKDENKKKKGETTLTEKDIQKSSNYGMTQTANDKSAFYTFFIYNVIAIMILSIGI